MNNTIRIIATISTVVYLEHRLSRGHHHTAWEIQSTNYNGLAAASAQLRKETTTTKDMHR